MSSFELPDPTAPEATDAVECGPLWISPHEMCEVRVRGRRVVMSMRQMSMLALLVKANGRVITREDLYAGSGGEELAEGSRTVDVHIARIRNAIGVLGRYVIAVPHRGYRIDAAGLMRAR